jgi:hypothetical protein
VYTGLECKRTAQSASQKEAGMGSLAANATSGWEGGGRGSCFPLGTTGMKYGVGWP